MSFELSDLRLAALRTAKTAMMWPNAAVKNIYRVLPFLCRNEGVGTAPGGKKAELATEGLSIRIQARKRVIKTAEIGRVP